MIHFLWVEDFAGNTLKSATEAVFGDLLKHQPIPDTEKAVKKLQKNGGSIDFFRGLRLKLMLSLHRKPSQAQRQHLYRILCDDLTKSFDRFSSRDLYKGIS